MNRSWALSLRGALAALACTLGGGSPATAADLTGVWRISADVRELKTADGAAPPLLPAAQQLYDQRRAQLKGGDGSFDATLRCKPMGQPRIMYDGKGFPFEIVQSPKKLFFGYQWNRQPRYVYVDQDVPAPSPIYYGYSSGHWDGDTLVVEVRGLDDSTFLDASGLPHSDDLHVTERYQLKNGGKQLQVRYTFEDARTFSKSWDAQLTFDKVSDGRIQEDICVDRRALFRK